MSDRMSFRVVRITSFQRASEGYNEWRRMIGVGDYDANGSIHVWYEFPVFNQEGAERYPLGQIVTVSVEVGEH